MGSRCPRLLNRRVTSEMESGQSFESLALPARSAEANSRVQRRTPPRDKNGAVAVFATAGFGPVPAEIAQQPEAERLLLEGLRDLPRLGESIGVRDTGACFDWMHYGQRGFFGYDWDRGSSRFLRMTIPSKALTGFEAGPRLDVTSFASCNVVVPGQTHSEMTKL